MFATCLLQHAEGASPPPAPVVPRLTPRHLVWASPAGPGPPDLEPPPPEYGCRRVCWGTQPSSPLPGLGRGFNVSRTGCDPNRGLGVRLSLSMGRQ